MEHEQTKCQHHWIPNKKHKLLTCSKCNTTRIVIKEKGEINDLDLLEACKYLVGFITGKDANTKIDKLDVLDIANKAIAAAESEVKP